MHRQHLMQPPHFTVQNTFFHQSREEGLAHPFPLPIFVFLCFRCMSKMMHNVYNYANETKVSIKYLSTLFIFPGDYLN